MKPQTRSPGDQAAEIYLIDYRMAYLQPVASGEAPIALAGSPSGRALATDEPLIEPPPAAGRCAVIVCLDWRGR